MEFEVLGDVQKENKFLECLVISTIPLSPDSHTSYLDITLKPIYLRGVIHVAKSSLLVDEALGFTIVVETTGDTLTAVGKHLD